MEQISEDLSGNMVFKQKSISRADLVRNDLLATAVIITAYRNLLNLNRSFLTYLDNPAHMRITPM